MAKVKAKTNASAKKRFGKVTKNGKIKRAKAYHRHLLTKKSSKAKRNLRSSGFVHEADAKRIIQLLAR